MKVVDVLIVEDLNNRVSEKKVKEALTRIDVKDVDKVIINKIHLPTISDDTDLVGVHIIVREVAET